LRVQQTLDAIGVGGAFLEHALTLPVAAFAVLVFHRRHVTMLATPRLDRKRRNRERERMLKERTAHTNRIKGLLHAQGIRDAMPLKPGFRNTLADLRTGDGRPLPQQLKEEIVREHETAVPGEPAAGVLEANSRAAQRAAAPGSRKKRPCASLNSRASARSAGKDWSTNVFYRRFDNRRQVGGYFGLVGMPYDSGTASATRASAKPAITAPANSPSNSPGCGFQHQPDSDLTFGSASGWATSKGAYDASPSWQWRAS